MKIGTKSAKKMDYIMKKLLVLLLLLISSLTFASHVNMYLDTERYDISNSSKNCWEYSGISDMISMGSKESICIYKNSDQKSSQGSMESGEQEGAWTYWWKNGEKKREMSWIDGIPEGMFYSWHDNGQQAEEGNYTDGKRYGDWTWWYKNGYKNYEVNYKANMNNGKWIKWDENGQIVIEAVYKNDKCISGDCP